MSMYGHDELNPWAMNPLMMMNMARLGLTSPLYQRALRERERERERRQDRDDLDDEDEADARDKDCVSCRTSRHRRLPDRIAVRERTLERTQENDSHTESGSFESHSTPAPRARAQSDSDEVARVASVDQNYVPQKPARAATPPSGPLPLTVRSVPEDEPERPRSQRLTLFPWRNRDERLAQNAKVWKPFVEEFKICAPGCEPYHYDADEENKYHKDSPNSCHVVGHALDVGGMICGGRLHLASNRGEFERVVNCVENRYQRGIGKIKTIYHDPRFKGHGGYTHAHFSLTCNGGKNW